MKRNTKKIAVLLCLLTCSLGLLSGCESEKDSSAVNKNTAIVKEYSQEPVKVKLVVSSDSINLSDLLTLELFAEAPSDYDVKFPALSEGLTQFKVWDEKTLDSELGRDGKIVNRRSYQLEPSETGDCEIPSLLFEYSKKDAGEDERNELITEPIIIKVTTSLPADMQDFEIGDIEDVVEVKPDRTYLWIGAGVVAVIIAGVVIWLIFKPKKPVEVKKVYKAAHEIAFEMLKHIEQEKLVEQGKVKEFYEKLSICLRQYIENRFSLRAPEQTTEEFLEHLRNSDLLKLEYKNELKAFLEHSDLVKFARYQPSNEQINESLKMAERFVANTMNEHCKVEIKGDEAKTEVQTK